MRRIYNFASGPATLPLPVLQKVQKEFLDYNGTGMSVVEISHRSDTFKKIIDSTEAILRDLMKIPDNYRVLFLQGGASSQFAMVPLNLFGKKAVADYINTGRWSQKAISEANRYGTVNVVASSETDDFRSIPSIRREIFTADAAYVHITMNNTVYGTRFTEIPDTSDVPIVADMSSYILSESFDVSRFGLIYAGAQKNIGLSGLTVVVVREDLTDRCLEVTPTMFRYRTHIESKSLFNTPPCFAVYFAGLLLEWIKDQGGIPALEEKNKQKASMLYDYLDNSKIFTGRALKKDRSLTNITFCLPTEDMTSLFMREAEAEGLVELNGHRSAGGLRASLYNAMPLEGVKQLVEFMNRFEMSHRY
jgi:phosphoserine aminotransferase